jgi:hypothetical protein
MHWPFIVSLLLNLLFFIAAVVKPQSPPEAPPAKAVAMDSAKKKVDYQFPPRP